MKMNDSSAVGLQLYVCTTEYSQGFMLQSHRPRDQFVTTLGITSHQEKMHIPPLFSQSVVAGACWQLLECYTQTSLVGNSLLLSPAVCMEDANLSANTC